ncbi:hypothetical protein FRC18_000370 [Serendipita sp. 400]|nr:hypothetical protein FRC18_000370 [Serendipita sp. 400]
MSALNQEKQYCTCRGKDDGRPMIHCDNCDNWFHFQCIELDEGTAAEIDTFYCEPCTAQTKQSTTYSWQLTDDELSTIPKPVEAKQVSKSRTKPKLSQVVPSNKQATSPAVPLATPTFAMDDSDSDANMKDDDGEYTGERQLTRIRRGKQQVQRAESSSRSPTPDSKPKKRKATTNLPATTKRKKTLTAKSPTPVSDPVRKYCYGKFQEVIEPIFLEYRVVEDGTELDDDAAKALAAKYVTELENVVFNMNSEPDKKGLRSAGAKYKERFRMLTYNLGQSDRVSLRKGIGTGSITASALAEMSSVELANEQTRQEMEKVVQEALHQSILKVQTSLPRAKMTHKGEELIETNASDDINTREEEEQERRRRLRLRTGSILEGTQDSTALPSSGTGVSSSVLENRPMDFEGGTPTSPDKISALSPTVSTHWITSTPTTIDTALAATATRTAPEILSPTDDLKTPLHASRPSFDLSSLWVGSATNEAPKVDFLSSTVDGFGGLNDEDEVAMDLDDEEPMGEQDFGMFLDGVEEKSQSQSQSQGTLERSTAPTPPAREEKAFATLPLIWSGELIMPLDPKPALINDVTVQQVGGRPFGTSPTVWDNLFKSKKTLIEGRVPTDRSIKYLMTTRLNSSKELVVVLFTPTESSKEKFTELFDFLVAKDRHGLVFPWGAHPPPTAPGKDLYLIPLEASKPLPEFIDLLDHVQIPKQRDENLLLGVFVLSKGKIVVPPSTPSFTVAPNDAQNKLPTPAATVLSPQQQQSAPMMHNDAVASLFSTLGNGNGNGLAGLPCPAAPSGVNPTAPLFPNMPPLPLASSATAPNTTTGGIPSLMYPYTLPPPPPPAPIPPVDAFSSLASSLQNLSAEQIDLILKGLSMTTPAAATTPQQPPPPQNWPPASAMYPPPPPQHPRQNDSYGQSTRSPPYGHSGRPRDMGRDDHHPRDRDRRGSSPPYHKGRGSGGGRDRGRGGRDRRGGGGSEYSSLDNGWGRRRATAPNSDQ